MRVTSGEHDNHCTGPPYPIICCLIRRSDMNGRLMLYTEELHYVQATPSIHAEEAALRTNHVRFVARAGDDCPIRLHRRRWLKQPVVILKFRISAPTWESL